jgi:hypothetical protein
VALVGYYWARLGTSLLFNINPTALPGRPEITLDAWLLGFTLLASLLTGVLFGLLPAWLLSGVELRAALQSGERISSGGSQRLRSVLVVTEIALALVLLVGAGLLIRSFWRLVNVEAGFDAHNVLTMQLQLPEKDYAEKPRVVAFYNQLLQRVQTLPGVRSPGSSIRCQ